MTLEYERPTFATVTRHDPIYTTLLGVFAFMLLLGIVSMTWIIQSPAVEEQGKSAIRFARAIAACYLIASVAVLVFRLAFPAKRKGVTLWFNIVILLYVPLGTALGLYGLFRVDKKMRAPNAPTA